MGVMIPVVVALFYNSELDLDSFSVPLVMTLWQATILLLLVRVMKMHKDINDGI